MCDELYEPHINGGFVREEGYRLACDAVLYFKRAVRGQNPLRFLFRAGDYQASFAEDRLFKASRIVYTAFKLLDRQLYGFCNFANKVSKI